MAETVNLVDLDIDQKELLKKITQLNGEITKLKTETKELEKSNKDLEKEGKKGSKQFKDNAKQIEVNKVQTKSLSTEYRNNQTTLVTLNSTENKQLGTLQKLELSNKQLREESKRLDLTRKSGQDRLKQVNKELDKNNATILKNADAAKKQKLNIGNYGSALQGLPGPLAGATRGVGILNTAFKFLIANPIGLILAAIALAIKAIGDAIAKNQKALDNFKATGAGIRAAYDAVLDRIILVSRAIKTLGKLNFRTIREGFKGIGEEMFEEFKMAKQLKEEFQALQDVLIGQIVKREELRLLVQKNRLAVKDENLTNRERLALLDEAIDAENELIALEIAEAKERARITAAEVGLGISKRDELKAEQEAIANVLVVEAAGEKRKIRLASERLTLARMVAKENVAIAEQEALAAAKALDNEIQLERIKSVTTNEIRDEDVEKQKLRLDEVQALNETAAQNELTLADLVAEQKLDLAQGFAKNIATIFGKNTAIGRAAAVTETAINTYRSATAAYAALAGVPVVGPILGAAAAGAAIAAGLANVKKILGIKSGLPGDSGAGGATGISAGAITTPRGTFQTGQISDGGLSTQVLIDNTVDSVKEGVRQAMLEAPQQILVVEEVTVKQGSQKSVSRVATV